MNTTTIGALDELVELVFVSDRERDQVVALGVPEKSVRGVLDTVVRHGVAGLCELVARGQIPTDYGVEFVVLGHGV